MTNFERIKEMSVEELAVFMCRYSDCHRCVGKDLCRFGAGAGNGIITYLESEEETNGKEEN